tara:strand:- start:140 stop:685 length:546 start_codon:yes stop_codon:yes gene_type:complete
MEKEELHKMVELKLTTYDIAKKTGKGQTTVRYWLRKHGLNTFLSDPSVNTKNGLKCFVCKTELSGRQHKYCCVKCKDKACKSGKVKANGLLIDSNQYQRERGSKRKLDLIKIKGGGCKKCGYNKNFAALCFHHRDEKNKTFALDARKLTNTKWESILLEADKCDLLCHNCHMELHYPDKKI